MSADKSQSRAERLADVLELECCMDPEAPRWVSQAVAELRRLDESEAALLEALEMWMHIHNNPSGFSGKYGKALDTAIDAQQRKIVAAAHAGSAAIARAKEARNGI